MGCHLPTPWQPRPSPSHSLSLPWTGTRWDSDSSSPFNTSEGTRRGFASGLQGKEGIFFRGFAFFFLKDNETYEVKMGEHLLNSDDLSMNWPYDLVSKAGYAQEWKWTPFIIRVKQASLGCVVSPFWKHFHPELFDQMALKSLPASSVCKRCEGLMILVNASPGWRWFHQILEFDIPGPRVK